MADASDKQKGQHKGHRWPKGVTPPGAKPWQPGQSGNLKGRPKGQTLMEAIRAAMKGKDKDKVIKAFVEAMQAGSIQHVKEYVEREEGKVPDRLANADGSNLELVDRPTWDKV